MAAPLSEPPPVGVTIHRVGRVDEFPVGRFVIRLVDGHEVGIVHRKRGDWKAVLNMCPHRYAPICRGQLTGTWLPGAIALEWGMEEEVLRCPWHRWEFSLETGKGLFGTTEKRLRLYPVEVADGHVFVDVRRHVPR